MPRPTLLLSALLLIAAPAAHGQGFGIMESAETIQRGNFKLAGYTVLVLGENGAEDEFGVVLRGGYGFTDRFDGELGAAFYDGTTLLGANVEALLLRTGVPRAPGAVNLAVRAGAHLAQGDADDAFGVDLAGLLSTHLTNRIELVGGLNYNHLFYDEPVGDVATLHLVPALELRLADTLDLLAEFGIGLDDDAAHYGSVGLAFYVR